MLIDGNSINGIFLYTDESSQVEFEKNDFVVSGDCIYICTAENPTNLSNNTVSGIDPKDDIRNENFKPYPGEMTSSAKDFFDYVESGGKGIDKYVSSRSLVGILQKFQFGLSMTGVIEDYIDSEGISSLTLNSISDNPIDDLMLTEDLNNGVVKVSPLLSYFKDYRDRDNRLFSTMFGYLDFNNISTDNYSLLLRQYTYKTTSTDFARIQELMSPVAGLTYYRIMHWSSDNGFPVDGGNITEWRNTYTYQTILKDKLDVLQSFYGDSADQLRAQVNSIRGAYRFREISINRQGSFSYSINLNSISTTSNIIKLTVTLQKSVGSDINLQQSLLIKFDKSRFNESFKINLPDLGCIVNYEVRNNEGYPEGIINTGDCDIVDAYYREYFDYE